MSQSEVGSHNILIYPDISTFREVYSNYIKKQLEHGNENVLILPYYETTNKAREVLLSEGIVDSAITIEDDGMNNDNNNRRNKYEKESSIIIKDSQKVYSSSFPSGPEGISNNNLEWNLIQDLVIRSKNSGKTNVTVIADLGSFFHHHLEDTQRLLDYEFSLPRSQFDNGLKLKGFCAYHKEDFEKRFTQDQKQKLMQHHRQVFMVGDR